MELLGDLVPANLFAFLLVFARIGTAIMLMPAFGEIYVMQRTRLGIALGVSLIATPIVAHLLPQLPTAAMALFIVLAGEMAIGAFVGFIGRIMVSALSVAGMIIAYQSSLANAFVMNPVAQEQGALTGAFLTVTGVLLIFVTDMHHLMLGGIVDSYKAFVPGVLPPVGDLADAVARLVSQSFLLAMQIGAPFLLAGLLFTMGVGLLNRLMPQVQMFFVVMPLQIALGIFVLMISISAIMLWFIDRFEGVYKGILLGP